MNRLRNGAHKGESSSFMLFIIYINTEVKILNFLVNLINLSILCYFRQLTEKKQKKKSQIYYCFCSSSNEDYLNFDDFSLILIFCSYYSYTFFYYCYCERGYYSDKYDDSIISLSIEYYLNLYLKHFQDYWNLIESFDNFRCLNCTKKCLNFGCFLNLHHHTSFPL